MRNEKVVLNFASKDNWYPRGQKRLLDSLQHHGVDTDALFLNDYPEGCPSHKDAPWGFKVWMFNRVKELGYRYALWCDAAVWAIKDIKPVFDHIGAEGHFLLTCPTADKPFDFDCDQTANDACLAHFNLTREEAANIGSIYACIMGLDLHNPRSLEFLDTWTQAMKAGAFKGDGKRGAKDGSGPRYLFHRHDQVCASIIAHRLGMEKSPAGELAMPYAEKVPSTVCLLTRGM